MKSIKKLLAVDSSIHLYLIRTVGIGSLLALPATVYYISMQHPAYWLLALVGIFLITKFGQAIGQHRYFSHNSFTANKYWHSILAILATLSVTGTVIHYAAIHRAHHRFSDVPGDPHSPYLNGFIRTWFADLDSGSLNNIPKKIVVDLVRDPLLKQLHEWYWFIIFAYVIILYVVDPNLLITLFLIPVGYSRFCTGLQATVSHRFGYRNFDTADRSTNNTLVNIVSLGEGSHNNHHAKQKEYNFGYTGLLKELDISAILIKYIIIGKKNDYQT